MVWSAGSGASKVGVESTIVKVENGITPLNASPFTLSTRPRNSSGASACTRVCTWISPISNEHPAIRTPGIASHGFGANASHIRPTASPAIVNRSRRPAATSRRLPRNSVTAAISEPAPKIDVIVGTQPS